MVRKGPHRLRSPLTPCLIFVLGIAFLAPLYHTHDHAGDAYQGEGNDHALPHKLSGREDLSTREEHNDSHLHIRKDLGRTDIRLRFSGRSLKPGFCTGTASPVFAEHLTCSAAGRTRAPVFRSEPCAFSSGLSPPAA